MKTRSGYIASQPPLLHLASRLLTRRGDELLKPLGFAIAQVPVLVALKKKGAALTQKELARIAQIEQPTMAQLLGRMERDGLIERIPSPDDKRSAAIALSAKSRARLKEAYRVLQKANEAALNGFSGKEIALFLSLLERVVNNLGNTSAASIRPAK